MRITLDFPHFYKNYSGKNTLLLGRTARELNSSAHNYFEVVSIYFYISKSSYTGMDVESSKSDEESDVYNPLSASSLKLEIDAIQESEEYDGDNTRCSWKCFIDEFT